MVHSASVKGLSLFGCSDHAPAMPGSCHSFHFINFKVQMCIRDRSTGIQLTTYQMGMAILLSCLMCMGTIVVPGGSVIVYTFLASSLAVSYTHLDVYKRQEQEPTKDS